MQAGALNTTGMTRHHRTPTPTDPAGSDQTTHSACLLTPPPAFPGVGRVAATSSLLCSVATHEQGAAHPTDTRWHAGTYRLPRLMCTGQGLILTESLPLYILCQKPEYTKGNLALSTKQDHGAGPPLPIPGPASTPAVGPGEGVGDAGAAGPGQHAFCLVCVPEGRLSIPQSLGRGSRKWASVPGTIRTRSRKGAPSPHPGGPRRAQLGPFLQHKAGTSSRKFCPQQSGHRGYRDWGNGQSGEAKALWPASGQSSP